EEEANNDAEEETKDKTEEKINNSVLLASILDPRIKKMKGWPEKVKERTIALLRSEYAYIKNKESLNSSQEPNNKNKLKEKMISNFKLYLFEEEKEEKIISNDEINNYLDRFQTLQANSNENLFK
ncbi:31960_t:CDS:2, partial [Gigaspora margarita]